MKKLRPGVAPRPKIVSPPKPAIPLYHLVNGRRVKRSPWAIQWDKTHAQH